MGLTTIGEVLDQLDAIVEIARERGTADGFFAALYRRVTAEVEARIARGGFEDGERMARFDVVFASRYVEAWSAHERGRPLTEAWRVAFGCRDDYWPVVVQHLLVGMNAHINLDLGIAAAEVAPGAGIHGLRKDFDAINDVLCEMVDGVQTRLAQVWPALRMIDRICGDIDEAVVHFSIRRARAQAWELAVALAGMVDEAQRAQRIGEVDTLMACLGRRILNPGVKLRLMLGWVRLRERGTMSEKLDVLCG